VVQDALQRIGRIVSFSSYMDDTALQSDLILPNHMALERYDDVIGLPGAPYAYYAVAQPILPPRLDTKHTGDVLLTVAQRMGGSIGASLPWKTYESYLQDRVKGLAEAGSGAIAAKEGAAPGDLRPGASPKKNYKNDKDLWKQLTSGLCWYDAPVDLQQAISTESGQYQLASVSLQDKGVMVEDDQVYLPHHAPLIPSGDEQGYPLLLVSYQSLYLANGYLPNPPFMTKTLWNFLLKEDDMFVQIHPETATSLGFKEGDRATLTTPGGMVGVRIHIFPGAHPQTVFIALGLGHKAYDEFIRDKGVNANEVIEVQMDPVTGMGTVWATRAQLARA
jgi:menaquinone reductase, molybdopterin-binding-like subunit